jgi:hypothetical protein
MPVSLEDLTVDQLLAHAKTTESSHSLLQTLNANPETREMLQRALKKANPNLSIPALDAKDAITSAVKDLREDNEKLRREIQEKDIRDRITAQRKEVRERFNLTDADVLEVEKIMTREVDPIPSYAAAAQVFLASKQSAVPTPAVFVPPTFSLTEGKDDPWAKALTANAPAGMSGGTQSALNRIAINEMYKAANEIFGKAPGSTRPQ